MSEKQIIQFKKLAEELTDISPWKTYRGPKKTGNGAQDHSLSEKCKSKLK